MRAKTRSGSTPATTHQIRRLSSWRNYAPMVQEVRTWPRASGAALREMLVRFWARIGKTDAQ